jgi:hypothetical protein
MTNTLATDPEVLQQRFTIVVEEFSVREGVQAILAGIAAAMASCGVCVSLSR